ncbi:MAG: PD-(D/E)XK nuclease family protein [Candidatus Omnitrophica bacterium]|nr:PD-(D/E)XK nuclease family protein [Candidatus Omnitrophota bacterium]MDD5430324.1 PD-(D/E)XK nuclease family protein [Candidatus Omnitrophota bacterium]
MKKAVTLGFGQNFIEELSDFLIKEIAPEGNDFSKIACVFGGQRPALFLQRSLARKIKKPFFGPKVFTIDSFAERVISELPLAKLTNLEAAYIIYTLAKKYAPGVFKGREGFNEFLPWANEIHSFIEQADLENLADDSLLGVERSAQIGYDVPASINILLERIVKIRSFYHKALEERRVYSRGRIYRQASAAVKDKDFKDFETIIFCNFFYLHSTEARIIREVCLKGRGICFFQGSGKDWEALKKNSKDLGFKIEPEVENKSGYNLHINKGFDMHSQVSAVRNILEEIKDKDDTVIVMPRPQTIVPLLSAVSQCLDNYNVSMGYPLKRSSLFDLFNALSKAQESSKDGKYYAKDYLRLLQHPLVKNLEINGNPAVTRIMVHKIEELLKGERESSIGGSLFLSLSGIEEENKIYEMAIQTLSAMGIESDIETCSLILSELHKFLFRVWENNSTFEKFAENLGILLDLLVEKSPIVKFVFNLKTIDKLRLIEDELKNLSFNTEVFSNRQIWEIFQQKLETEVISFIGSPLRGTQVLGLFETRSLNFENVIIMDMNEGVFPKLKVNEPLIPREVMLLLGLNRLEKEEEIQRYQFHSLISGAKNVYLVYEENQEKEKSRFIEELIWQRQAQREYLETFSIPKVFFTVSTVSRKVIVNKTPEMVEHLKRQRYSASRINTYLSCPLQFYYEYVLGFRDKEDMLDEPDASCIGNFMHGLLEEVFEKFKGLSPVIDAKFKKFFFRKMDERFEKELARRMKSDSFILKKIIHKRLDSFLDREAERQVAKIICLEEKRSGTIEINGAPLVFNYTIDRIDELKDGSLVIIDYKSGSADKVPKKLAALRAMEMNLESIRRDIKSFQLPLYCYFVSREFPSKEVNAQLYSLRTLERKSFISDQDADSREKIMEICLEALGLVCEEIFSESVPFIPKKEQRICEFCRFRLLCS